MRGRFERSPSSGRGEELSPYPFAPKWLKSSLEKPSEKGVSDTPGVYLAPVSGPKRASQAGLGALRSRVSGASGTFRTVSEKLSKKG